MIECKIENYENNKQEQICVKNDQTRFSEIVAKNKLTLSLDAN